MNGKLENTNITYSFSSGSQFSGLKNRDRDATDRERIIIILDFTIYPSSSKYFEDKGVSEINGQYRYMIMNIISVELFARTLMIKNVYRIINGLFCKLYQKGVVQNICCFLTF